MAEKDLLASCGSESPSGVAPSAPLKFGDLVECDLSASHGVPPDRLIVAGVMTYSPSVYLLTSKTTWGMPCGDHALTLIEGGHEGEATTYRARYLAEYPEARKLLRPLPAPALRPSAPLIG